MGRSSTWILGGQEDGKRPIRRFDKNPKRQRKAAPPSITNLRDEIPKEDRGLIEVGGEVKGRNEKSCEEIEVGVEDKGRNEESCEEIEVEDERIEEEEEYEVEESYEEFEVEDEEYEEEKEEEDEEIEEEESYEIEGKNEESCEEIEVEEAAAANNGGKEESADTVKRSGNGSLSVTLTDPELLNCPVCFYPLTTPVFQCLKGHIACEYCCTDLKNVCPSCRLYIGHIRNKAVEKILKSTKVACPSAKYGCNETTSYTEMYDHQEICDRARFVCPLSDCDFVGPYSRFHLHFIGKHYNSTVPFQYNKDFPITINIDQKVIVLQEGSCRAIFILYNVIERPGNVISVSCFAPSWNRDVTYNIMVRSRRTPLRFHSCTKNVQNLDDEKTSLASLLVPSNLFDSNGQLKLFIHIRRP